MTKLASGQASRRSELPLQDPQAAVRQAQERAFEIG